MTVVERGKYHLREYLANGQYQLTVGLRPIHYQDDGGLWQAISTDWAAVGGARPNAVTAAPLMVSVADDGLRRIHPTRDLNKYVEIGAPYIKPASTWQKVSLGTPTRSGNLLTWTTTNANGYCWHAGHYVKLGFLLKGGWTPPNGQFAFPVGISGLTRTGNTIYDNGVPVMLLDAPVVYDLDNEQDRRDITFSFTSVTIGGSSQPVLLMTLPDLTGMSRPLVDPTLTLQPDATAGIDTLIGSGAPNLNNGTSTALAIGDDGGTGNNKRRTLIKFDLSTLPSTALISSATLSLYATTDISSNARTFRVFRVKRAWTESGATYNKYDGTNSWDTAGGFGVNDCEQTDIGTRAFTATETLNQFKAFSLTPTTKTGLDYGLEQGGSQTGFLIKADTEVADGYYFSSSDDATAANRPKLVIVYIVAQDVSGSVASSGALAKQTQKALTGTLTSAGALARQTSKSLIGALTSSGALSALTQKFQVGAIIPVGALLKQANKPLSGAVSMSGSLSLLYQVAAPMCIAVADSVKTSIALSDRAHTTVTLSDASC